MRRSHPILLPCLGVALAACSGATRPLVDEPPSSATEGSGGAGTAGNAPTNGGSEDDASSAGKGAGNSNGNGNGNGNGSAAPTDQCPAGARAQASSGGDDETDATPFSSAACGTIAVGQTYWWTFSLSPSTTQFGFTFSGHVQLEATVNGTTMNVAPGTNLPFDLKHPYDLRITSSESQPEPYVIVVTEQ